MKRILFILISILAFAANSAHGQEVMQDKQEIVRAQVVHIIDSNTEMIPGTDTPHLIQNIEAKILTGLAEGKTVTIKNDLIRLEEGETFYAAHLVPWDGGTETFIVSEPDRLPQLGMLAIIFVILVVIFGGKQGARGIASLIGSLAFIVFALIPGIIQGYSPILLSIVVSSVIIVLGSYITHGFNKTTTSAVIGMVVTVLIVGIFAHFAIGYARLAGFGDEEATYLNFNFRGTLDLAGILLGGILIGLLGVMYDAAIGQAISVEELHRIAPHVSRRTIYSRAIRIGREHIGALVNTLAIAYVGASLPLLLLFYSASGESIGLILNRETFATEIVRSLVGSIGLILAVPVTTVIAVFMLVKNPSPADDDKKIEEEMRVIEHAGHRH
ncbi:MAG TPA: YibE/F family protein [Candidatus Paceibacterota bacterium]|nr:YibE/F family protein [Candidatus Paceibacterota bacterium]